MGHNVLFRCKHCNETVDLDVETDGEKLLLWLQQHLTGSLIIGTEEDPAD